MMVTMNEVMGKSMLEEALVDIKSKAPFVKNARIATTIEKGSQFVTTIEVFLKKHGPIMATKIAATPRMSVQKTLDAIFKQLDKVKFKRHRKNIKKLRIN